MSIKGLITIILWIPALAIKLLLALIGLVAVPLTKPSNPIWGNNEHPVPPHWFMPEKKEKLRDYVWRAIRNPVNNVRYLFEQPEPSIVSGVMDPDDAVRSGTVKSAARWIRSGVYSEYWYLRRKGDKFFEFRIGWKFSDVPGFAPTLQLGLRSR